GRGGNQRTGGGAPETPRRLEDGDSLHGVAKSSDTADSMQDAYRTITEQVQAEIKVERSRFIGTAVPVSTREAAEAAYDVIRRRFHDATHNCFAFRVGVDNEKAETRYSD